MKILWLQKEEFFPKVLERLERVESVLDIGCGVMPQRFVRPLVHICCEPFIQYVEFLKEKLVHEFDRNYVIMQASWSEAIRIFPSKSVDSVFLIDVIEHLAKDESLRLLRETENIVRRQVAVFTPLGFFPQKHIDGKDAWGMGGADWQEHKSGWQPEDFDDSWEIFACKDYHTVDNFGNRLESPFGAIWAIRTFAKPAVETSHADKKRRDIYDLVNMTLDINREYISTMILHLMRFVLRIKTSKVANYIYNEILVR